MIRFNSDYTEGCHTAILEKLVETNMEQTAGYGEDEYCGQARELIRKACGFPGGRYTDECHCDLSCIKALSGSDHGKNRAYQCP